MSDLITAWVDEDEMRRLAASLLSTPLGYGMNQMEVNYGSQFEGFADGLNAVRQPPVSHPLPNQCKLLPRKKAPVNPPQAVAEQAHPVESVEPPVAQPKFLLLLLLHLLLRPLALLLFLLP